MSNATDEDREQLPDVELDGPDAPLVEDLDVDADAGQVTGGAEMDPSPEEMR